MNNLFLNKTVKTFITSLIVSVFIFGSFYFLLSEPTSDTSKKEIAPSSSLSAKDEKSKKLVVNEEDIETNERESDSLLSKNSAVTEDREILGATTTSLLAQIPGDFTTNTTPQATLTTPSLVTNTTPPSNVTRPASGLVATGVPSTGSETLYVLLGVFSLVAGFLIVNGKSLAMKSFEHQEI
jgi:hypothetical protein